MEGCSDSKQLQTKYFAHYSSLTYHLITNANVDTAGQQEIKASFPRNSSPQSESQVHRIRSGGTKI